MATERAFHPDETFEAAADLSAKQYLFVEQTAEDKVNVCDAVTDMPIGVLQNKPKITEEAQVRIGPGISKLVTDGSGTAIAVNDRLSTSAAGKGVKAATAAHFVGAIALGASSADGTIITALVLPPGTKFVG